MCVFVVPSMYVFSVMPHMSQNSMSLGYRFVNILLPYVMLYVQVDYMYYLHYLMMRDFDDETLVIFVKRLFLIKA